MRKLIRYLSFEERFIRLSNIIENLLIKMLFLLLSLLILAQLFLTIDFFRDILITLE